MKPQNEFTLRLFHYWRSSASWRVRWALEHKKIPFESVTVDLLKKEQLEPAHLSRNPTGTIPVLEIEPGRFLSESTAILEWLEETHPEQALLPQEPSERAVVRQIFQVVNSGIHPLQNMSVIQRYSSDESERKRWVQHWIERGLTRLEKILSKTAGCHAVGGRLTMADLALIPQIYNAKRFEVGLESMPTLRRINESALGLPCCKRAHPDSYAPQTKP